MKAKQSPTSKNKLTFQMKNSLMKLIGLITISTIVFNSCGDKTEPPLVYFPDMYYPVAYDPLMKTNDPYTDHENEIPAFVANNGATGLTPVSGTVPQNKEGVMPDVLPKNVEEYNTMYDASKAITSSPLDQANAAKDIERGKKMYEYTCLACHGSAGDGQGPIVASGAFAGVPAYKDRQISVGSVHYVLTNGRNAMGSYAGQLTPADRWRVAMYIMKEFKADAAPVTVASPITTNAAATTTAAPVK